MLEVGTEMCRELANINVPGFHIYTLNLETSTNRILDNLGVLSDLRERRSLPWRKSALDERQSEQVRPDLLEQPSKKLFGSNYGVG